MVTPLGGPAVRLLDGRVLVVGGEGDDLTSAELYDPATGSWSATGKMVKWVDAPPGINLGKEYSDATLLGDGKVLVTAPNSAQLYDPASGTWTATGKMIGVFGDTATLLGDGKVLITGWDGAAQLYDPASGTWTATGKMITDRLRPLATLLSDGRVLVAGGQTPPPDDWTKAAEIYDPVTGSWTEIADMQSAARGFGIATQLPDGKVLCTHEWDRRSTTRPPEPGPYSLRAPASASIPRRVVGWHGAGGRRSDWKCRPAGLYRGGTLRPAHGVVYDHARACFGAATATPSRSCSTARSSWQVAAPVTDDGACVLDGRGGAVRPCRRALPPLPAFPSPPACFSRARPAPTTARCSRRGRSHSAERASWTITVEHQTSEPATMFVAEGEDGVLRLVGSATPNVVPANTTMKVTFRSLPRGRMTEDPREPATGEGADVGSVGRTTSACQASSGSGPSAREVLGGPGHNSRQTRAEGLRRLCCAGHSLPSLAEVVRSRMASGIYVLVTPRRLLWGALRTCAARRGPHLSRGSSRARLGIARHTSTTDAPRTW
jgi:hypothetical protein